MIYKAYVETMAHYNKWQNQSVYGTADRLSDDARRLDRGAFFGSIHQTLCHLFWGDSMWMSRFNGSAPPEVTRISDSQTWIDDWDELKRRRADLDAKIVDWSQSVSENVLQGELTWYSGAAGKELTKPMDLLVVHMFNHQTHHRGQVHAMITAAGGKPDDTDLPFMP